VEWERWSKNCNYDLWNELENCFCLTILCKSSFSLISFSFVSFSERIYRNNIIRFRWDHKVHVSNSVCAFVLRVNFHYLKKASRDDEVSS
jgi:hypothetical protein